MNKQTQKINHWLGSGSINIFGLPFSGKDTQASIIAKIFNSVMISSGDILRHDHGNKKIQEIMASGGIIPSSLFEEIVLPFLSRGELRNRSLVLSSVGRAKGEESIILHATASSGHPTKAVIFLNMPESEVWQRFDEAQELHDRGNRDDDKKSAIEKRLQEFRAKTLPVINYYEKAGLLIKIDGTKSKESVTKSILDQIEMKTKTD